MMHAHVQHTGQNTKSGERVVEDSLNYPYSCNCLVSKREVIALTGKLGAMHDEHYALAWGEPQRCP